MSKTIIYSGMKTPDGTLLESVHRHDCRTYVDANGKTYMLDGGRDYVRSSANGDEEYITVYMEDGHEKVRQYMKWGTYGKKGDQPLKWVKLAEMETDHIKACLRTQKQMPASYRESFETELKYRDEGH